MIKLYLGNLGSGKTLSCVRDLKINDMGIVTYSNIQTHGIVNNITLKTENILAKEIVKIKKDGTEIYKYKLNVDFWKAAVKKHKVLNVILDEAHRLYNARKSTTSLNLAISDFLSLLRRVVGEDSGMKGTLILITQLDRRIDVIAREMATQVKYHLCYVTKKCPECDYYFYEHNEVAIQTYRCPNCNHRGLKDIDFTVYVWTFANMVDFDLWKWNGIKTYVELYQITHAQKYFKLYSTRQWDDLISEY